MNKAVSIIIRTKNEERWIGQCIKAILSQGYRNFEVIIVDNESTDKTIEKANQFKEQLGERLRIITCKDYLPGKALNIGFAQAAGEYVVSISGHCIPVNSYWLDNLLKNFDRDDIAGVYGRQEPMSFTPDADKRDLNLVFGLDRKVQIKDSFFHNANSAIRKGVWFKFPFDENITNIEDRVWAKQVLQEGYKLIYEPEARVYHYHGIHQNGDIGRCTNVVRILETLNKDMSYKSIEIEKLNIVALIPVRGEPQYLDGEPLLAYTIKRALESKYIKKAVVSTDDLKLAELARGLGAETPFIRDPVFSKEEVSINEVCRYSLEQIEKRGVFPDLIVLLEITFPFRPAGLLDDMISKLATNGFDSIVAAKVENKAIWKEGGGEIVQLNEGFTPRKFKDPTFIELRGIGCVTYPEFVRNGRLLGDRICIYELKNPCSQMEVRSEEEFKMASILIKEWF